MTNTYQTSGFKEFARCRRPRVWRQLWEFNQKEIEDDTLSKDVFEDMVTQELKRIWDTKKKYYQHLRELNKQKEKRIHFNCKHDWEVRTFPRGPRKVCVLCGAVKYTPKRLDK